MRILANTLKPRLDRWDDPDDYPSGADGGPLPSCWYVESIDGTLEIELDNAEIKDLSNYADVDMTWQQMLEEWFDKQERVGALAGIANVAITKWRIEKHNNARRVTLSVDEFEES